MTEPETAEDHGDREQSGRNPRRVLVITIVVLAIVLGGLFAWRTFRSAGPQWQAMPPTQVAAIVVQPQDAPMRLESVGSISAVRQAELAPDVAGRVANIRFNAGDYVRAGQLLVQLYDAPLRADRAAAQARAKFARLQLQRSQELAPTGAEPRELLEQRRSQLQQSQAEIAQLDARLRQLQVRAPFSGRLGIRQVDPGQYLNAGQPVVSLTALNALFVDFSVPQQQLNQLKPGRTVQVASDAWPGRSFSARLSAIEPQIDEDTRNIRVQARLANPDEALRPGMYVTASLELPPQRDAIVLPVTAIQTSAQGNSVIVIRGDNAREAGKAEVVPVKVGRRIGDFAVVESGLAAGDVVVTEGQLRVQPGAEIQVSRLLEPEAL